VPSSETCTLLPCAREEDVSKNTRFQACLRLVRKLARDRVDPATGAVVVAREEWPSYRVRVASMNTFPTAAGLASSAAGYACLVYALAQLFNAEESYPGELSVIARQGSGSACRSLYGGLVRWEKGSRADGCDSRALQIADEVHWPEMRTLIMVVSDAKKDTSSTAGMVTSARTSELLAFRAQAVVPRRVELLERAYLERDFAAFGELTMRDSNQFHATCLDTYPPIFYMNDTSRALIRLVHAYNDYHGGVRAAYTFDAGPNAVIYTLEAYQQELLALLLFFFPPSGGGASKDEEGLPAIGNLDLYRQALETTLPHGLMQQVERAGFTAPRRSEVKMVYCTKVGGGPRRLAREDSLLDPATGLPFVQARAD
jgi:diphosphomevalonate decarboxylase